jgi:hypothetical protein
MMQRADQLLASQEETCVIELLIYRDPVNGTRQRSWLRHYATSPNVIGSIPDELIGFFNSPNPSSSTVARGDSASNRNEYQESSCG